MQTEQIRTISTERVAKVVGRLPLAAVHVIDGLLRTNLALD